MNLNSSSFNIISNHEYAMYFVFPNTMITVWEFVKDPMTLYYILLSHHHDISSKIKFVMYPLMYDLYYINTLKYGDEFCLVMNNYDVVFVDYFRKCSFLLQQKGVNVTKVRFYLHYIEEKKTLFTIRYTSYVKEIQKKRQNLKNNFNLLFNYIEKMDYDFLVNNTIYDAHVISAEFEFCIKYFLNSNVLGEMLGEVKSINCDEIKKGTIIQTKIKGEDRLITLQIKEIFLKGKMFNFFSNVYHGKNPNPFKLFIIKVYSIDDKHSNMTYFVLITKFYTTVTDKQENFSKKIHKLFAKKITNCIEKSKQKELNYQNESKSSN